MREFQDEATILRLLNTLNKKHIIQLYLSYKHQGSYNFLFPLADGDLEILLTKGPHAGRFGSDTSILKALWGLGVAIASLHDFYSEKLGVEFNGCHHDLKPRNILVSQDSFLLADFGLSSFKAPEIDSKSLSKNLGDYFAPECREPSKKRKQVGRKSDIWSFGCIAVELLAYMIDGAAAVQELRDERESTLNGWTNRLFHSTGCLKGSIQTWLGAVTNADDGPNRVLLADLATRMLHHDPNSRPVSAVVQNCLCCLYAKQLVDVSLTLCATLVTLQADAELFFAAQRLKAWAFVVGLVQMQLPWSWAACQADTMNEVVNGILEGIHDALRSMVETVTPAGLNEEKEASTMITKSTVSEGASRSVYQTVDKLWILLSPGGRKAAQIFLLGDLLKGKGGDSLSSIKHKAKESSDLTDISAMAEMKEVVQDAAENRLSRSLQGTLPAEATISENKAFGSHEIGKYSVPGSPSETVLIEWRPFYSANEPSEELRRRVDSSAKIPNVPSKPVEVRVLECIGFREDPERRSFAMIYRLASGASTASELVEAPLSLSDFISSTSAIERGRPYLGQRFDIARAVVSCISFCHASSWLHRGINSFNIIFLTSTIPIAPHARLPYIIGFNHSREDEENALSYGPPAERSLIPYLHPDYIARRRFRRLFEYYSVGMVLLEIGLWRTLASIQDEHALYSSKAMRTELISRYAPRLLYSMGEIYYRAVVSCLDGDLGSLDSTEDEVWNAFQIKVVRKLYNIAA